MFVFELLRTETPLYTDVITIVMAFLEANREELKLTFEKCSERAAGSYKYADLMRRFSHKTAWWSCKVVELFNKRDQERALVLRRHRTYGCYDGVRNYMQSVRKHHAHCMLMEHLVLSTRWYRND